MSGTLFITYDGLSDPLGGSQILPYLRGIATHHGPVHLLSFEKPARLAERRAALEAQVARDGIGWTPVSFTSRLGKAGKAWDLARMHAHAAALHRRHRFDVIHCRSYQAMQVGMMLGRISRAQTIFDMRGLWVNERVDGGLWRLERAADRQLYRVYKQLERVMLREASHVVVLTERVVPELRRLSPDMRAPVTVIPCCADFELFVPPTPEARARTRAELGIGPDTLLLSYLGSLGTWYLLDDILRFFARVAEARPGAKLLFITKDWGAAEDARVDALGLSALRTSLLVRSAAREAVPALLGASDVMLSFIKPAYSKLGSSPTKLAEAWALGVPAISNGGVGDVEELTVALDAGAIARLDDPTQLAALAARLDEVRAKGGVALRERARPKLGLEVAHASYRGVYERLERAR